MQTYLCQMSDVQRRALVDLIRTSDLTRFDAEPGDANDTMREELVMLADMLDDLPNVELEHPGILHGLCL